ncbi:MAG: hypothetical protein PWQ82_1030 [Thermosediminibacterales bacterium]|nr:hypothetical protein [Thermosediminibacterales bacterium]
MSFYETFLEMIFPKNLKCRVCGRESNESHYSICASCVRSIEYINPPFCLKCGKPLEDDSLRKCYECKKHHYHFVEARSVGTFTGVLKKAVYRLKYKKDVYIARPLAVLMAESFKHLDWPEADIIIPVPLSNSKLFKRGFNQSYLLARELGKLLKLKVSDRHIIRVRDTDSQTKLTRAQRWENMKGAFEVFKKEALKGRTIILVDDIFTTGATVDECSRTLIEDAGVKEVYVFTLATAKNIT